MPALLKYLVSNVGSSGSSNPMSTETGGPHIANLTLVFPEFEDLFLLGIEIKKLIHCYEFTL